MAGSVPLKKILVSVANQIGVAAQGPVSTYRQKRGLHRKGAIMGLKRIIAATAVTGSLGAAALGLGASPAQADPGWGPNIPWVPGPGDWVPDADLGPGPGDVSHWC